MNNRRLTEEELFEIIKIAISDRLGIDTELITPESKLIDDLDADSLDLVELVMFFEEEFDINISDEAFEEIIIVKDIIYHLKKILESETH